MDLAASRKTEKETARAEDLMKLIPDDNQGRVIDIGARDGWLSNLLSDRFDQVVALDLRKPLIVHPKIQCVVGDATCLPFSNEKFNTVFCAEVLEHIPPESLQKACIELERVAAEYILIGVPFKQDIRIGRTTCGTCGRKNPPWGHVNVFHKKKLKFLFSQCNLRQISYVGKNSKCTNAFAVLLMDLAGNPYGTYCQKESCIHCGAQLVAPRINTLRRIVARIALYSRKAQKPFHRPHPNWIHVLFEKRKAY